MGGQYEAYGRREGALRVDMKMFVSWSVLNLLIQV